MSINNLHFIRLLLKKTEICRQKSPAAEFVGTFYSRFWDFLLWGGAYRRWIAQILRNDTEVVPYGWRFAVGLRGFYGRTQFAPTVYLVILSAAKNLLL